MGAAGRPRDACTIGIVDAGRGCAQSSHPPNRVSSRGSISPGENLRLYRELQGLTQEELGKRLGNFRRQNISNIENGHRAISKNMAVALAELFDVSVEKFL